MPFIGFRTLKGKKEPLYTLLSICQDTLKATCGGNHTSKISQSKVMELIDGAVCSEADCFWNWMRFVQVPDDIGQNTTKNKEDNVFILQNTKDVELTSADYLPELDETTLASCERCRQIMKHAQKLLKRIPAINKNAVYGICDHCRLKQQSCSQCEEAVKNFHASKEECRGRENLKERMNDWLNNVRKNLKDAFIQKKDRTTNGEVSTRARSEISIDEMCLKDSRKCVGKLIIKDLIHPDKHSPSMSSDLSLMKKHIEIDSKDTDVICKSDTELHYANASDDYIGRQRAKKQKHIVIRDVPPVPFPSENDFLISRSLNSLDDVRIMRKPYSMSPKEEMMGNSESDFRHIFESKSRTENKAARQYRDGILPPGVSGQYKHEKIQDSGKWMDDVAPKLLINEKIEILERKALDRGRKEGRALEEEHNISDGAPKLGVGQIGLHEYEIKSFDDRRASFGEDDVRRLISDMDTSYDKNVSQKTPALLKKSYSENSLLIIRNFKFYFPNEVKLSDSFKRYKSSSELIKDTQEKLKVRAEKEKKRFDEELRKKSEEKEQLDREERKKIAAERKRFEEKEKIPATGDKRKVLKEKPMSGPESIEQLKPDLKENLNLKPKAFKENQKPEAKKPQPSSHESQEKKQNEERLRQERDTKEKEKSEKERLKKEKEDKLRQEKESKAKEELKKEKEGKSNQEKAGKEKEDKLKHAREAKGNEKSEKERLKKEKEDNLRQEKEAIAKEKEEENRPIKEKEDKLKQEKKAKEKEKKERPSKEKEDKLKLERKAKGKEKLEMKSLKKEIEDKFRQEKEALAKEKEKMEKDEKLKLEMEAIGKEKFKQEKESKGKEKFKQEKEFKEKKEMERLKKEKEGNIRQDKLFNRKEKEETERLKTEKQDKLRQENEEKKQPKKEKGSKFKLEKHTIKTGKDDKFGEENQVKEKEEKNRLNKEKEDQEQNDRVLNKKQKELEQKPQQNLRNEEDIVKLEDILAKEKSIREEKRKKEEQESSKGQDRKARETLMKLKNTQDNESSKPVKKTKSKHDLPSTDIKDALKNRQATEVMTIEEIKAHKIGHIYKKTETCAMCISSDLELQYDARQMDKKKNRDIEDIIIGPKIFKYKPSLIQKTAVDKEVAPLEFQAKLIPDKKQGAVLSHLQEGKPLPTNQAQSAVIEQEVPKGVIRYALSDRTFIEKGWTMLPTEKVVRKMNVYRMRPAHPEFDWFEHNKNKRLMEYDSGERLAEFDDKGRGRWFYRNGRLALDYYDAEELNAQQRFVIYSSGEPDERGRPRPYTILATFDYLGNGIVFDHGGKIRLKYNQTEGVLLDRSIGPVSHWKWHALNDPPVLQQVMIDTQMAHPDPEILKLPGHHDRKPRNDNDEMLAIEFDNFIKEKSKKLSQTFKPFQIKMKALKINEHFSLRVLDQATVYLIFRDGTTNLKLNIGMILDHKEIVDTDTAEVGEVSNSVEKFPACTDSLAEMQKSVAYAQHFDRCRTDREHRLRRPEPSASVDKLVAAASRPMRFPLRTVPTPTGSTMTSTTNNCYCKCSRKPTPNNVYYDNRLF